MDQDRSIYRVSPWRRAVFWCVFAPFLVLGLALWIGGEDESTRTAGVTVTLIIGAFLVAWEWLLSRTYVALTVHGVELHQLGMQLRAPWSDVVALSLRRGREGFIVERPLEGRGAARLTALTDLGIGGAPLYDDEQRLRLREQRFIPIEAFAWHVQHGTLAREVTRLAPHVQIGGQPTVAERTDVKKLVWIGLLMAVAVGCGIWLPVIYMGAAVTVVQALAAPFVLLGVGVNAVRAWRSGAWLIAGLLAAALLVTIGWMMLAWQGLAELLS